MDSNDHDLLIEINSNMKFAIETQRKHELEDATKHSTLDNSIRAAHKRIDGLTISGILAIIFLGISLWFRSR